MLHTILERFNTLKKEGKKIRINNKLHAITEVKENIVVLSYRKKPIVLDSSDLTSRWTVIDNKLYYRRFAAFGGKTANICAE